MIVKKRTDGMLSITATSGQSIYDLCLMTYGDFKYLYKLIQDSNLLSPNTANLSGKEIIFNPELVTDKQFYNSLSQQSLVINTLGPDSSKFGKSYNRSFNISFH